MRPPVSYFECLSRLLVGFCLELPNRIEKGVLHGLGGSDAAILVVDQHLVKEINAVLGDPGVVVLVDIALERDLLRVRDQLDQLLGHVDAVPAHVLQ